MSASSFNRSYSVIMHAHVGGRMKTKRVVVRARTASEAESTARARLGPLWEADHAKTKQVATGR